MQTTSLRWVRTVAIACVGALLVLGTSASAASTPQAAINWGDCPEAPQRHPVRCARISVPVNWDQPDGQQLDLRVAKWSAARPEQRIGTLLFNPGGPGGQAAGIVALPQAFNLYFPPEIRDRFDIVGIDPRGVGGSQPVRCAMPAHDPSVSRFPTNPAELAELTSSNARFAESCREKSGALVEHLDTESVARDFDAVRQRLGEQRISFLGLSYGTMLAQSYAELFPQHVRTLVLDGVVDRSRSWERMVRDDALAAQDGVNRFVQWCQRTPGCGLRDARAAIGRLFAEADAGRLTFRDRPATADEVGKAINAALNVASGRPRLAESIRTALETGDGTALLNQGTFTTPALYRPYRTIICHDVPVRNPEDLISEAQKARALAPDVRGASEFWDIASGCAGWPADSGWRPHPWQVPEGLSVLLISGAHDVATPRAWAESVHRQIQGSDIVRWAGDGHTAWLNDEPARQAGVDYLLGE